MFWQVCKDCGEVFDVEEVESDFNRIYNFDIEYYDICEGDLCLDCATSMMEDRFNGIK